MIGKTPKEHQMSIFDVALESFIDMNHELVLLSKQIDWEAVESEFAEYYCVDNGRPSVPIWKMVGIGAQSAEKIFKISRIMNAKDITAKEMKLTLRFMNHQTRNKFQKRAGIEPVIGHLKSDHRMIRNYLKGTLGDAINTMMAAAAYNMRHWMNKNALYSFVSWLKTLVGRLENVIFENVNQYARQNSNLAIVAR